MRPSIFKIVFLALMVVLPLVLHVDGRNNRKDFRKRCICKEPGMGKPPTIKRKDCKEDCIKCSELTRPFQHYEKKGLCVQCTDCNLFGQISVKACTETSNTYCEVPVDSGKNVNPQSVLPDVHSIEGWNKIKTEDHGLSKSVSTRNCTCQMQGMGKPPSRMRDDCSQQCIKCSDLAVPYQHYEKDGLCVQCMDCGMFSQSTVKACTDTMNTVCAPKALAHVGNDGHKPELSEDGDQVKNINFRTTTLSLSIGCTVTVVVVVTILIIILYKRKNTPANNRNIEVLEMGEIAGLRRNENTYEQVDNYRSIHNNHMQQQHDTSHNVHQLQSNRNAMTSNRIMIIDGQVQLGSGEPHNELNEVFHDTGDNASQTNSIQSSLQDKYPDCVSEKPTNECSVIDNNLETVLATPADECLALDNTSKSHNGLCSGYTVPNSPCSSKSSSAGISMDVNLDSGREYWLRPTNKH